jgi:LEA14-like dessication related protein
VLLAALLLGACAGLSSYPEQPRVSLVSIQPLDMTLLEQRYGLQLRILNPNDSAIPVEGLNYSLEINGREFAYGVSRQAVTIPPFGEALLDVDVVSNLLNVLQQMQELGEERQDTLAYRLSGKLSLSNSLVKLPFDYHGELKYSPASAPTTGP